MNAPSLRAKLTLLHIAVVVIVFAVAALAGRWSLSKAVHDQLDAALLALAETEEATLASGSGQPVVVHEVSPGPAPPSFVRLDRLVQVIDGQGAVLARSSNLGAAQLPVTPDLLARLRAGETVFQTLPAFGEEPVRMVTVPVRGRERLLAVQVAGSLDDVNKVVASASTRFAILAVVLLAAVGMTGAWLTRRVFRAIDGVVRQARLIGEGNLGERLPHPGSQDEIGALVDTLNQMLARLERSFEAQRHFTADASHELRSPLSRLRAELEVTLRRPRETAEYVDALRSCFAEVERLTQLLEELLLLARLDASQERRPTDAVELNRIAEEAIARVQGTAAAVNVAVTLEAPYPVAVRAIGSYIGLVFTNLLDNAIKFSPPGGNVNVAVTTDGSEAVVNVSDAGPGIEPTELPHLFERFYRGAAARAHATPGNGLGLALSQAIVSAYGGRIEASSAPAGGALFTIRMPLAAARDPVT